MNISSENERYLSDVEKFVNRKFLYRKEIAVLLELASSSSRKSVIEEIIFYAKFLTKAYTVLQRQGIAAEETQKLSDEYSANIVKTTTLIRMLIQNADMNNQQLFEQQFFVLTHSAMEKFLAFVNELSWLKNYAVDKGL